MEQVLVLSVKKKVLETIELTEHLTALVPADLLSWHPPIGDGLSAPTDLGHLLGHLLDCLAGLCAALFAAFPAELADFAKLRSITVNEFCTPEEALESMKAYRSSILRGFDCCADADLSREIKTVFAPEGETLLTLLLGNLEHLMNHKYQLFFYLKLSGVPVTSRDLYQWRGASSE